MPSFFKVAVPALALAGSSFANPLKRGNNDACVAAVTGKAALGDDSLRKEHCSSFIKTIVTPPAITITTTVDDAEPTGWHNYKKRDVTVCPNEVPNYASACDEAAYKSACKVFGVSGETTYTIPATTTTKTVYRGKGTGSCDATATKTVTEQKGSATVTVTSAKVTDTVTVTKGKGDATETVTVTKGTGTYTDGETVTVTKGTGPATTITVTGTNTVTGGSGRPTGQCISKDKADFFVNGFIELLEYTDYAGNNKTVPPTPAGRGYKQATSDAILDTNFVDYSDSINWMAGFPLGSVTFASKQAFDLGQGKGQAEVEVETLDTWYGCNTITWRWLITTFQGAKIRGINQFEVSSDGEKLISNHAEFNNAGWLYSFGLKQCLTPGLPPPTYQ